MGRFAEPKVKRMNKYVQNKRLPDGGWNISFVKVTKLFNARKISQYNFLYDLLSYDLSISYWKKLWSVLRTTIKAIDHSIFLQACYKLPRVIKVSYRHIYTFSFLLLSQMNVLKVKSTQHHWHNCTSQQRNLYKDLCSCPELGSILPHPLLCPEQLQASAPELSPMTNSVSRCHSSSLFWL